MINPNMFANSEVRFLAEQMVEELNKVSNRIDDIEKSKKKIPNGPRHQLVNQVLDMMEAEGKGREFFIGKTTTSIHHRIFAYAEFHDECKLVEPEDKPEHTGMCTIITNVIMRRYNLKCNSSSVFVDARAKD